MKSEALIRQVAENLALVVAGRRCKCPAGSSAAADCATKRFGLNSQGEILTWVLGSDGEDGFMRTLARFADVYRAAGPAPADQPRPSAATAYSPLIAGEFVPHVMASGCTLAVATNGPLDRPTVGLRFNIGAKATDLFGLELEHARQLHADLGRVIEEAQTLVPGAAS